MSWPPQDTIQRMRVRYRGSSQEARAPGLQIRLERLLRGLDWRPRGMKPGAVLLIRRLTGLPALDGSGTLSADWERAFRDRLQTLYERAIRPRGGLIPTDAESILFDDEAGLLLQLTHELSLSAPAIPRSWYWQQVLQPVNGYTSSAILTSLWTQYIRAIPAVFTNLPHEQIIRYARLLQAEDAEGLIDALCVTFRLPRMSDRLQPASGRYADQRTDDQGIRRMPPPARRPQNTGRRLPRPPWPVRMPATAQRLAPSVQVFIAWAITLRRDPALARHPEFTRKIGQWLEAMRASPDTDQSPPWRSGSIHVQEVAGPVPSEPTAKPAHTQQTVPESKPQTDFIPLPEAIDGIWTRLGGVLFLYHVLRWLDLPAAWDERISAWAAIEALACALLGGRLYPDDPIWQMLAMLDEREPGTRIGDDIEQPRPFRMPAAWVERYGDMLQRIQTAIDWPDDARQWIAPNAAEWLRGALPFIRTFLWMAIADPDLTLDAVVDLILLRNGQLSISNTHIDLHMLVRDADVRLRRAGLDLDPAWAPGLGYIVLFHYTE